MVRPIADILLPRSRFNCAEQAHPWLTSPQNEWGEPSWLTEILGAYLVPMLRKPR
jgi:hypothetical protein